MTPVYGHFAGSSQVCGANSPEEIGIYVCLTTNHSNSQNIVLKPGVAVIGVILTFKTLNQEHSHSVPSRTIQ